MNNNGKIGAALVGGYLLGRTKKAKMAIGLGMFLAGKKLNLSPQQLARTLADSPVVGRLGDQVRKDLIGNTKSALTSAVTQRAGSLADSLHERTLSMNDPDRSVRGSEDAGEEEAEEPDGADRADRTEGAADGRDEGEEREGSGAAPRARKARKATAAGGRTAKTAKARSSSASGSPDGKAASGGSRTGASRTGASRTGASRSGASRTGGGARKTASTASSGTRGAAGGARKTAAKAAPGGPRKAANRGGGNG